MSRALLCAPLLWGIVALAVSCGGDEPEREFLGTGVDRDERVAEGLHRKTLISRAYAVLAEQINVHTEPILATGPVVSRIFYGRGLPMITLAEKDFKCLSTGQQVVVDADSRMVQIKA